MISKFKIIVTVIILSQVSCIRFNYEKIINKDFLLAETNHKEDRTLYYLDGEYYIGLIGPTVIGVGYNKDFIILKQKSKLDSRVYYYIVSMSNFDAGRPKKNVIGPLSIAEFNKNISKYKINNIKFTINFH